MERVLTDGSALVRLLGGDNRLAAVVIGGLCLAVAAVLCTLVIEPVVAEESMRSSADDGRAARDRAREAGAQRPA